MPRKQSARNKVILDEGLRGGTYREIAERVSKILGEDVTLSTCANVMIRAMKKDGGFPGRTPGCHNAPRKTVPHRQRVLDLYAEGKSNPQILKIMKSEGWEINYDIVYSCIYQKTRRIVPPDRPTIGMEEIAPLPQVGEILRYIVTSAQNDTEVDPCMKANLNALAKHYNATILIGKFVYRVGSHNAEVVAQNRVEEVSEPKWDDWVEKHANNQNIVLAKDLIWEGGLNCLPTADNPLSGFDGHGRSRSLIFPHAKQEMKTVARHRSDMYTRFNYTTGCVTVPKYVARKAGIKAHFHHVLGALLVEINDDGDWWVRQINDCDGVLHDLNLRVENGEVTKNNPVAGITVGDLHLDQVDEEALACIVNAGGMIDALKPEVTFFHDVLEFRRSHHNRRSPIQTYLAYVRNKYIVEDNVRNVCQFLAEQTDRTKVVVINSNHDRHLAEWLDHSEPRSDPPNMKYYYRLMAERIAAVEQTQKECNVLELAASISGVEDIGKVTFVDEDESYMCEGIECGMHGDRGPNGSRGTPQNHTGLGSRVNIGHSHTPAIRKGVYVAGTTSTLYPDYAKGPTSWAQGHIAIYPGGKRAILCMRGGKLWAEQVVENSNA